MSTYITLTFLPPPHLFSPFLFFLSNAYPLEVVKVVGVPPAYPPFRMENPPRLLLHTWLLLDISTYQVGLDHTALLAAQLMTAIIFVVGVADSKGKL